MLVTVVVKVIDMINKIANAGVPVFVSAGNEGDDAPYYDSLSTYAKYTATSIGSIEIHMKEVGFSSFHQEAVVEALILILLVVVKMLELLQVEQLMDILLNLELPWQHQRLQVLLL